MDIWFNKVTSTKRENILPVAGMALVAILFFVAWKLVSLWLFVIPPPVNTFIAFSQIRGSDLAIATRATFGNAAIAFVLAIIVGTALGIAIGRSEYWYRALNPIIVVGGAVPKIIIYPILLLLLGLGHLSVIGMGFIGGIFAVLINIMVSVRDINPVYIKVGQSMSVPAWRAAYRIYLPAVRVPLLTGIRLSFGLTLVNVVFAELFAAKAGVGKLIMQYYNLGQFASMMSLMFLLFIVAMTGSILLWAVERRVRKREGL